MIHAEGGDVLFGPPGKTEFWQPIDAGGLGYTLKTLAGDAQLSWLDETWHDAPAGATAMLTNWDRWSNRKVSASQLRVLMTFWFAAAWEKSNRSQVSHLPPCLLDEDWHRWRVDGHSLAWHEGGGGPGQCGARPGLHRHLLVSWRWLRGKNRWRGRVQRQRQQQ